MNRLTEQTLQLDALLDATADPDCGALVVFGGTVRFDGRVDAIDYSAYVPLAEKALAAVEAETLTRFPDVRHCRVLHRLGMVALGELSVLVVVRGGHRASAFEAARWAIDTLKERVPVWKEERFTDGGQAFVEGVPIKAVDTSACRMSALNIAVLTISDTRTLEQDRSGQLLVERLAAAGHRLAARQIVRDDIYAIRALVSGWIADQDTQVILTTGGTGVTGRDGTPEAIAPLLDKQLEGFGELFRSISYQRIGSSALQSRCLAGVANGKYLFCLPGSVDACETGWDQLLRAQLDINTKPCNFAQLLGRLRER